MKAGQLRAYILSGEGREITIYRLFDRDMCLFSASCMMRPIQFEVTIAAEKDTDLWIIPVEVYQSIMVESAHVANYTSELMATRFSDVMWLIEQIMWKSLDKRISAFLLEEAVIEGSDTLKITHETIANHLGSHREVITRMLKYFQNEGMVKLSRGTVEITDPEKLEELCEESKPPAKPVVCSAPIWGCYRSALVSALNSPTPAPLSQLPLKRFISCVCLPAHT